MLIAEMVVSRAVTIPVCSDGNIIVGKQLCRDLDV